ncbi:hypothetical protein OJ962_29810, partial [Solirubrobacter sp. CPCC 204708]
MGALGVGEPQAGSWRVVELSAFAALVLDAAGPKDGRPAIVAVDGRSAGGKTSFADRLAGAVSHAAVVHTDDVAWW